MAGRAVRLLLLGRSATRSSLLLAPASRALPSFVGLPGVLGQWCRGAGWRVRYYSELSGGEGEGEGEESDVESGTDESDVDEMSLEAINPASHQHAIASVAIPDSLPEVPVLAVTRNPIFPKFVKMLEVSVTEHICYQISLPHLPVVPGDHGSVSRSSGCTLSSSTFYKIGGQN